MIFIIFVLSTSILLGIVKKHSFDLTMVKMPTISNELVDANDGSEKNEVQESLEAEIEFFSTSFNVLIYSALVHSLLNFLSFEILFKKINLKKELKPPKLY